MAATTSIPSAALSRQDPPGQTVASAGDPNPGAAAAGLATQVARLFFERQLSKVEIAARLGISRFRVARLIDRALAEGAVRIEFRDAPQQQRDLAAAMERAFGLDLCVVASTATDGPGATAAVAALAADVVDGLLGPSETIGVAWGSTLAAVVGAMRPRSEPSIDVVQLAGSSRALGAGTDPGDLTRVLAARIGGAVHPLHAPAFVDSVDARAMLLRQPEIAATMHEFARLSLALIGVGSFGAPPARGATSLPSSSLLRSGAMTARDVGDLVRRGAIGDLVVHPFDERGRFVPSATTERAIAISVDDLRNVPRVVAVAAGREKAAAIRGALRTGVIRILVTDATAAREIVTGAAEPDDRGPRAGRR
ncbi:MAG TPA: sugar-binding domain-containing protein [Candidatus Limnocylindrales bacterium]|nr:sugar-binding domain-containing protein [Candidatus Limnocylindrales bacterium]